MPATEQGVRTAAATSSVEVSLDSAGKATTLVKLSTGTDWSFVGVTMVGAGGVPVEAAAGGGFAKVPVKSAVAPVPFAAAQSMGRLAMLQLCHVRVAYRRFAEYRGLRYTHVSLNDCTA